jgi:hypothetical protein
MTQLIWIGDPSRRTRRSADRPHDVQAATRAMPMTCLICGELLFSHLEQERGVCAPCYLKSLRDGRRWSAAELAKRSRRTPNTPTAGTEAAESIPPRAAPGDTGRKMARGGTPADPSPG